MARKIPKLRVTTYVKNVGKSFGYAVGDIAFEYAPTFSSIVQDSKNLHQEAKASTGNIKDNIKDMIKEYKSGIVANTLDDLKTGNWYNKKREEDAISSMFGDDDDWDFGDDDFDDEDSSDDTRDTKAIINSIDDVGESISKNVAYSSARSAEYIVSNQKASTRAMYELTGKGFNQVSGILLNMSDTMVGIASLGEPLSQHIQNSGVFYTKTTEQLEKISSSLDKLIERTAYMDAMNKKSGGNKRKNGIADIISGGEFSLSSYVDMLKEDFKERTETYSGIKDMLEMMLGKGGKNASLAKFIPEALIKTVLPNFFKATLKQFNETLNNALVNGMMRGSKAAANSSNPLINFLGSIFLPEFKMKKGIETGKFKRGPMQWDGEAKHALTRVIPDYLAKIYASLSGDQRYFDYESGKYKTIGDINKDKTDMIMRQTRYATRDIKSYMTKGMKKNKAKDIEDEFDKFIMNSIMDGNFDIQDLVNLSLVGNRREARRLQQKLGISEELFQSFVKAVRESKKSGLNKNRNLVSNFERDFYDAQINISENFRRAEENGSILGLLNHGFLNGGQQIVIGSNGNGNVTIKTVDKEDITDYTKNQKRYKPERLNEKSKRKNKAKYRIGGRTLELTKEELKEVEDALSKMESDEDKDKFLEGKQGKELYKSAKDIFGKKVFGSKEDEEDEEWDDNQSRFKKAIRGIKHFWEKPFYAVSLALDNLSRGINNLFWGKNGIKEKLSSFWDGLKEKFNKFFNNAEETSLKEAMSTEWQNIKSNVKDKFSRFAFGDAYRSFKNAKEKFNDNYNATRKDREEFANEVGATGSGLIHKLLSHRLSTGFKRGGSKFRSSTYSGGSSRFIGKTDNDQEVYESDGKYYTQNLETGQYEEIDKNSKEYADIINNAYDNSMREAILNGPGVKTIVGGAKTLASGIMDFLNKSIFGDKDIEEQKKALFDNLGKAMGDVSQAKGSIAIGAIGGAGVSLLTGALVGPIAGAAIGAGIGLASKSEAFQNFLFGEGDPESKDYKKGLLGEFGRKLKADGFKSAKGVGIGAAVGGTVGTVMGSPVVGALIGSAAGYVTSNEKARKKLFGDFDQEDPKTIRGKIIKHCKDHKNNIAAGVIATSLVGPFGILPNMVLGAGIGYLSSSEKFKDFMFGNDKKGIEGLTTKIHDKIVNPLDEIMHNIGNMIKGSLNKIFKKVSDTFTKLSMTLVKRFHGFLERHPVLKKFADKVKGVLDKVNPLKLVTGAVEGLRKGVARHNIRRGYDVYDKNLGRNVYGSEYLEKAREVGAVKTKAYANVLDKGPVRIQIDENGQPITDDDGNYITFRGGKVISPDSLDPENPITTKDSGIRAKNAINAAALVSKAGSKEELAELQAAAREIQNRKLDRQKERFNALYKNTKFSERIDELGLDPTQRKKFRDLLDSGNKNKLDNFLAGFDETTREKMNLLAGDLEGMLDESDKEFMNKNKLYQMAKSNGLKLGGIGGLDPTTFIGMAENEKGRFKEQADATIDTNKEVGEIRGTVENILNELRRANHGEISKTVGKDGKISYWRVDPKTGKKRRVKNAYAEKFYDPSLDPYANPDNESEEPAGEGSRLNKIFRKLAGAGDEDTRTEFDMAGNPHQYKHNNQGEWVEDEADRETKKSRKAMDSISKSLESLPLIGTALSGFKGLGKLFGSGEDSDKKKEKKGFLESLADFLDPDSETSGWARMAQFLATGKGALATAAGNIGGFAGLALIGGAVGGLTGALNETTRKLVKSIDKDDNETSHGRLNSGSKTATLADGSTVELQVDSRTGKAVTDENGNYLDNSGNPVSPDQVESISSTSNRSLQSGMIKNMGLRTARNLAKGKTGAKAVGGVAAGMIRGGKALVKKAAGVKGTFINKAVTRGKSTVTGLKAVGKSLGKCAGKVANSKFGMKLAEIFGKLTKTLGKVFKKLKINVAVDKIDDLMSMIASKLTTKIDDIAAKSGKALAGFSDAIPVIGQVMYAVDLVVTGTNAWGDAENILGIIEEATTGQKIVATLIAVINEAIPFIGGLIPHDIMASIVISALEFVKFPFIQDDIANLRAQQEYAKQTVNAYNRANRTNYTIEEYNLNVNENVRSGWWTETKHAVKSKWDTFWNKNKNKDTAAQGSGLAGGSSGFVSQFDPRYQNYKVSGSSFAGKGCGPAVAAMTASALGKNMSVGSAVNASKGYQVGNGVTLDYFQKALGSQGIDTEYIAGSGAGDLYNSIASGKKVVLLGQDRMNTSKANSPFGPNNHYVVATGLDRSGNVVVNDPELNGPTTYSPGILNSVKYGVAAGRSGLRHKMPKFKNRFRSLAGGATYDSEIAKNVWALLHQAGFTDVSSAAIMGNLYAESGMKPDALQNGRGPAAGIAQWENYNTKSGRFFDLFTFAKKMGRDWTDLEAQIAFLCQELSSKDINDRMQGKVYAYADYTKKLNEYGIPKNKYMTFEFFKAKNTDLELGVKMFCATFERCKLANAHLDKRLEAAKAYYSLYSGKEYKYTPSSVSTLNENTTSDQTSSATTEDPTAKYKPTSLFGVLGSISSLFSDVFNGAFGKNDETGEDSTSEDSTGTTDASSLVDSNASGGPKIGEKIKQITGGKAQPHAPGKGNASSVVDIARSQLGVTEAGNNITDYGKFTGADGQAWCASFASWVFDQAFNGNTEMRNKVLRGGPTAAVATFLNRFQKAGAISQTPQPGDLVIYRNGTSHVGIVEDVQGNQVYTIEGNTSGDKGFDRNGGVVYRKSFDYTNKSDSRVKKLTGFGRPDWSAAASYNDIANNAGGSSGILMHSRAGSRNGLHSVVDPRTGRLVPYSRFAGGATNLVDASKNMLNELATSNANNNKNSGINPELIAQLLSAITNILNNIADNTAPVNKIYQALSAYLESGGSSGTADVININRRPQKVANGSNNTNEIDSNLKALVTTLADLAKG